MKPIHKTVPTVLLTGATGNIGSRIAADILETDSSFRLVAVARSQSGVAASERVASAVRAWHPGLETTSMAVLEGDLRAPHLGLARADYLFLADSVTHIIHCAATTCFAQSACEAHAVNVMGTANVMALAKRSHRRGVLEHMAHISTAYVCGNRQGPIFEHELVCGQEFVNTYEASKLAGERMLRRFANELPLTVFRPSIVVGDSRTGHVAGFNAVYFPLQLICTGQTTALPALPDAPLDIVPVDHVSRLVRHLTLYRHTDSLRTLHVVSGAGRSMPVREIVNFAVDHFGLQPAAGGITYVSPKEWRAYARGANMSSVVRRALELYAPYMAARRSFDDRQLCLALSPLFVRPPVFETYFGRTLDYCADTAWGRRVRLAA